MNVKVTVTDLSGERVLAEMSADGIGYALHIVHHPVVWQDNEKDTDRVWAMVEEFNKTGSTVLVSRSRGLMIRFKDLEHVPEQDKL